MNTIQVLLHGMIDRFPLFRSSIITVIPSFVYFSIIWRNMSTRKNERMSKHRSWMSCTIAWSSRPLTESLVIGQLVRNTERAFLCSTGSRIDDVRRHSTTGQTAEEILSDREEIHQSQWAEVSSSSDRRHRWGTRSKRRLVDVVLPPRWFHGEITRFPNDRNRAIHHYRITGRESRPWRERPRCKVCHLASDNRKIHPLSFQRCESEVSIASSANDTECEWINSRFCLLLPSTFADHAEETSATTFFVQHGRGLTCWNLLPVEDAGKCRMPLNSRRSRATAAYWSNQRFPIESLIPCWNWLAHLNPKFVWSSWKFSNPTSIGDSMQISCVWSGKWFFSPRLGPDVFSSIEKDISQLGLPTETKSNGLSDMAFMIKVLFLSLSWSLNDRFALGSSVDSSSLNSIIVSWWRTTPRRSSERFTVWWIWSLSKRVTKKCWSTWFTSVWTFRWTFIGIDRWARSSFLL